MIELLKLLEENARISNSELAILAGMSEEEVENKIKEFEEDGTIVGYPALIDWDKTDRDYVTALIEIKVAPQKDKGFDDVANQIANFSEVESVYLMSGGFDLMAVVDGKTMRDVAMFVSARLSTLSGVTGTATHFVLRKYKEGGKSFSDLTTDERGFAGV
ncbi:MAG: Lrp/AsnC family transcriptional regulator [Clostridia bacterium]